MMTTSKSPMTGCRMVRRRASLLIAATSSISAPASAIVAGAMKTFSTSTGSMMLAIGVSPSSAS